MSDGDGIVGTINEAVIKPVADEVGKAVEVGIQSVTGKTPTPQQTQQKEREDQLKRREAERRIAWWKQIANQQQAVRTESKQVEAEKGAEQKQESRIKQFEIVQKKKESIAQQEAIAKSQAEKGVGHKGE